MVAIRAWAYAKINLTLEVLGRRADGYHEVMTILQTIDLADRLDVLSAESLSVECDEPSLSGEANLVWQAAVTLAKSRNIAPKARIIIRKRIPVGMGLGGGSSDAAAALVALNQLWELRLPDAELAKLAAELGSDVPFFLFGGTALGRGRGEQISPLPALPALPLTLICPHSTIPNKTAFMYSRLNQSHYSDGGITTRMAQILTGGQFVVDMVYNVFESVAFEAFPHLDVLFTNVDRCSSVRPHLAGAGPTLFCLPSSEEEHGRVKKALHPLGIEAYLVHTTSDSPKLE